jgi:CBS domain-containing protein
MRPITAADMMSPHVLTVREDMTLEEVANFLTENEISGAPVEDAFGKLVGVVSLTDVARTVADDAETSPRHERTSPEFFLQEWEDAATRREIGEYRLEDTEVRVGEIMTSGVYSVTEETPVAKVARMMIDNHIHRVLVTREERAVGIISTSDLLGLLVEEEPE